MIAKWWTARQESKERAMKEVIKHEIERVLLLVEGGQNLTHNLRIRKAAAPYLLDYAGAQLQLMRDILSEGRIPCSEEDDAIKVGRMAIYEFEGGHLDKYALSLKLSHGGFFWLSLAEYYEALPKNVGRMMDRQREQAQGSVQIVSQGAVNQSIHEALQLTEEAQAMTRDVRRRVVDPATMLDLNEADADLQMMHNVLDQARLPEIGDISTLGLAQKAKYNFTGGPYEDYAKALTKAHAAFYYLGRRQGPAFIGRPVFDPNRPQLDESLTSQEIDFFLRETHARGEHAQPHMNNTNLTKPVDNIIFKAGTIVEQWQRLGGIQSNYYYLPGQYRPEQLGIGSKAFDPTTGRVVNKIAVRYEVVKDVEVLRSSCAMPLDNWSVPRMPQPTIGDGIQHYTTEKTAFRLVE